MDYQNLAIDFMEEGRSNLGKTWTQKLGEFRCTCRTQEVQRQFRLEMDSVHRMYEFKAGDTCGLIASGTHNVCGWLALHGLGRTVQTVMGKRKRQMLKRSRSRGTLARCWYACKLVQPLPGYLRCTDSVQQYCQRDRTQST